MDSKINKGRLEFNDENYEKALTYFDAVDEEDEDYNYVLIFKITCLMELERYDKALFIIDSLLKEDPGDELLLYEKIRCHIALNEKNEAFITLNEFEKIISPDNKEMVLDLARFYKILGDYQNALRFCNRAMEIDGSFEDAVYEKSLIAIALDDVELIDQCADKLYELVDGDKFRIIPVFLLKLYSCRFKDCIRIVDEIEGDVDDEMVEMLKTVIFNQFCGELDVNIHLTGDIDLSIGEAIQLLVDYDEKGIKSGVIDDVGFVIM